MRPADTRALVAIDLGAESCRVSLLRWLDDGAEIQLVHRFPNHAVDRNGELHWDIESIFAQLVTGLERCAQIAAEGIRSIGVDGWAVDYVRVDAAGDAVGEPFCYRDERTVISEPLLNARLSAERMRELTGVQILRINTVYQQFADTPEARRYRWLNLPEYVLYRLGGRIVSELTNATHTQMCGLDGEWSGEIFSAMDQPVSLAPDIVPPGTDIGAVQGSLAALPAFAGTRLIAPCCHDTASAIAAVPDAGGDWAYISSGTWSLVGTLLDSPVNSVEARAANFTNLGGAEGKVCFHKNVNGMWLLRQCLEHWEQEGAKLELAAVVEASAAFGPKSFVLDVDDPDLLAPGDMPARINAQLKARGLPEFSVSAEHAAELASFLFHSLAVRYAEVLRQVTAITGKKFRRLYIFGGGSQNEFLNRLTSEATGIPVQKAGTEGSTLGNFAVQLAAQESSGSKRSLTGDWARALAPSSLVAVEAVRA